MILRAAIHSQSHLFSRRGLSSENDLQYHAPFVVVIAEFVVPIVWRTDQQQIACFRAQRVHWVRRVAPSIFASVFPINSSIFPLPCIGIPAGSVATYTESRLISSLFLRLNATMIRYNVPFFIVKTGLVPKDFLSKSAYHPVSTIDLDSMSRW